MHCVEIISDATGIALESGSMKDKEILEVDAKCCVCESLRFFWARIFSSYAALLISLVSRSWLRRSLVALPQK